MDPLASATGESGAGKETPFCATYDNLFRCREKHPVANRGSTFEGITDSESPGYEKGLPIGVTGESEGHPGAVNKGISPSDEAGESLPLM